MKRQMKSLLLLLGVVLVLVAAFFTVKLIVENTKESEKADERDVIFSCAEGSIVKISWEYGENGPITIYADENGRWWIEGDSEEVNQAKALSLRNSIALVKAERTLSEINPAEYGFDQPTNTVTVVLKNGEGATFIFGGTSGLDDFCYLKFGDQYYIVSYYENAIFNKPYKELLESTLTEEQTGGTFATTEEDKD